jgi:murein DD-endopeptidase MepM/ murein hydrolase activator NlpD
LILLLALAASPASAALSTPITALGEGAKKAESSQPTEAELVGREQLLLIELDALAAALAEAQGRATKLEERARGTRAQLASAKIRQAQAEQGATRAAHDVRFALSRLLRGSASGAQRPILRALHRNLLRATERNLHTLQQTRSTAQRGRQRIAELVAHQTGLGEEIEALVRTRKKARTTITAALLEVRSDRRRARAHAKALETRRLDMARWLESLRPALTAGAPASGLRRGTLPLPVAGKLFNGYGWQEARDGLSRWRNRGLDFQGASGTRVVSAGEGRVTFVGRSAGLGLAVVVDHGKTWRTVYGGLGVDAVAVGDAVKVGETLGRLGDLGQLHFELRHGTLAVNPTRWFTAPPLADR